MAFSSQVVCQDVPTCNLDTTRYEEHGIGGARQTGHALKAAQNKTRQDQGTDRRDGRHHDPETAHLDDQKKILHLLQQDNCQKNSTQTACRTKSQNQYT